MYAREETTIGRKNKDCLGYQFRGLEESLGAGLEGSQWTLEGFQRWGHSVGYKGKKYYKDGGGVEGMVTCWHG